MQARDEKLKAIINWSENNKEVRAVLLTSSLVNPLAPVDDLSDLDIELIFGDNTLYVTDHNWTYHFGTPIAMVEEDERNFNNKHAMKMVLYEDGIKVDFKLYSATPFLEEVNQEELPEDWDIGYKVMLDKDGITQHMKKPTYRVSIIKKPTEHYFKQVLNDFWWDTVYVAKSLVRDELFYAKFSAETCIRKDYLIPLIEWYIASQYQWNITTNKHGRLFKKYLTAEMWKKIEQTFSGSKINENWSALFAMADMVAQMGRDVAGKLGYAYPEKLEKDIRNHLNHLAAKH